MVWLVRLILYGYKFSSTNIDKIQSATVRIPHPERLTQAAACLTLSCRQQTARAAHCLPCVVVSVPRTVWSVRSRCLEKNPNPQFAVFSLFLPSFSQNGRDEPGYDRASARAASDLILEPLPSIICTKISTYSYIFFILHLMLYISYRYRILLPPDPVPRYHLIF